MDQVNWISQELEQVEQERKTTQKNFLKLEKGEHVVEILLDPPSGSEYYGRKQKIFKVRYQDKELLWGINTRNPIYRVILQNMKDGKNVFKILRSGDREKSKFEVLSATKKGGN